MGIFAKIVGNLTADPATKVVTVKGEQRNITEIRVFADFYFRNEQDELVQDDEKSTGVNVTIWNERLADGVAQHLRKGARVQVEGDMYAQNWHDRETGEKRFGLHVDADTVTLVLSRIDKIDFRAKAARNAEAAPA